MCDGDDVEEIELTREEVRERVLAVVCEQMNVTSDKVTDEASFVNDLGADSLDVVELEMEFEDDFDISMTEDEAQRMTTVGSAIDLIFWKVNGRKGPHPFTGIEAKEKKLFEGGIGV